MATTTTIIDPAKPRPAVRRRACDLRSGDFIYATGMVLQVRNAVLAGDGLVTLTIAPCTPVSGGLIIDDDATLDHVTSADVEFDLLLPGA